MAPNVKEETVFEEPDTLEKLVSPQADPNWKHEYIPKMIMMFTYVHIAGLYGLYLIPSAKWTNLLFMYLYFVAGNLGMTAGTHRLWSHNAFKAKTPLQILLMLFHASINQFSVIWWVEIHRQHHKYADTDGDPMNASRGLVFSHIGWLCLKRHPEAVKRRKFVDVSDVRNNPVLMFEKKHAIPIITFMSFIFPLLPVLWGESFKIAFFLNMLRLALTYNTVFTLNSIGHAFGNKPYDKSIQPSQSDFLFYVAFGDGYHNFHHAFPWDYRSGEFGGYNYNFTAAFIEFFAKIGWAYDLKSVPRELIDVRSQRTGDGSRKKFLDYEDSMRRKIEMKMK